MLNRQRLQQIDASLFSDRGLFTRQLILWTSLLALFAWCGLGSDWNFPVGQLEVLQEPVLAEGIELSFYFAQTAAFEKGTGQLFKAPLGWTPLRTNLPLEQPEQIKSLRGTFHSDGTFSPSYVLDHPLREEKTAISAAVAVLLGLALVVRYRHGVGDPS